MLEVLFYDVNNVYLGAVRNDGTMTGNIFAGTATANIDNAIAEIADYIAATFRGEENY